MKDNNYHEGSRRQFLELASQVDTPAFVRRALSVENAEKSLIASCRAAREKMLEFCRMRLGVVGALVDKRWVLLNGYIGESMANRLGELHEKWQPQLRLAVEPSDDPRKLRRAIKELITSFESFNRKWDNYLATVSLNEINATRDQYNKYYVVEKSAAFLSDAIGKEGFEELQPFERDDLECRVPKLEVPRLS
ncbi:MAG: hypothetical protein AAF497_07335 [Planctomycetota bacterium]